jgi:uncharacterized membrane protein YkvA (DUF1232 family)
MLKKFINAFKRDILVYKNVMAHPDCPALSRWCLYAAVVYALSPIDIIPDFIPVLGYFDDVVILAALIAIALRFVPRTLVEEVRAKIEERGLN